MLETLVKLFFGSLSAVAPRLAATWAFRLFCRTPAPNTKNNKQVNAISYGKQQLEGAQTGTLKLEFGDVAYYQFSNSLGNAKTVCLVHGWNSQAALMSSMIKPLLLAGFNVVLIDLPGYGDSSGRVFTLPMGVKALAALHKATGPWHALVAHSLGGAVASSLVSSHLFEFDAPELSRLVLISSPDSMPKIFDDFSEMIGLSGKSREYLAGKVLAVSGQPVDSYRSSGHLKRVAIPTLVLHAPDDKEVPFSEAESIATAGDHIVLTAIPGAGHRRIVHSEEVRQYILDFIT